MEVSKAVQGLFHWGGQSITVDSVVVTQDSITKIIKEERSRERNERIGARTSMTERRSTGMSTTDD